MSNIINNSIESDKSMKGFPERIYVTDYLSYGYIGVTKISKADDDLDKAVPIGEPIEVGIYQLIRVAKFQKRPVEVPQPIVKEIT